MALAWCFEDERTENALAGLDAVVSEGAVAPQLWPLEVMNGLLVAERRGRLDAAKRRELVRLLCALPVRLDDETATRVWTESEALAVRFGLSVYDACYLELALRRGLALWTLDRALGRAALACVAGGG